MKNCFAALLTLATLSACALPGLPLGPPPSTYWGTCPEVSAGGDVLVTVRDAAGRPMGEQDLLLAPAEEPLKGDSTASAPGLRRLSCVRGPSQYGRGRTDADGQYRFSRIEPGDYVVRLEKASPAVEVEVSVRLSRLTEATLAVPAETEASAEATTETEATAEAEATPGTGGVLVGNSQ